MTRPTALLFDLDGTLVDSAITIAAALTELSTSRGGAPADVAAIRQLVSKGAPMLVREALGAVAGDGAEDVAAFRAILAGIPANSAMIFPGVIDALTALCDHPCAVVTNKPEGLARLLLDQLDLSRFFRAVIGGDTLSVCKPDPAPLRLALSSLGPELRHATMIGDSMLDARAAQAAGLPFILYEAGYEADSCEEVPVYASFAAFGQLPALIASIASQLPSRAVGFDI